MAFERGAFFARFAGAPRRARQAGLSAEAAERLALEERSRMLLEACAELSPDEHVALFREAHAKGDNGERIAVLRTLPLSPEPARFVEVAAESCRTHVVDVFCAIACDNVFPSRHFSELQWNQLVMKAFFLEVPLASIVGVAERRNAELERMALDFAAERRAAGRTVPADLPLALLSPA